MRARVAHHRHDEVARLKLGDSCPDFHDLGQGFVSQHQEVRAGGRAAVLEMSDFAVSATDADIEDVKFHVSVVLDSVFWNINDVNGAFFWKDPYSSHSHLARRISLVVADAAEDF